jgi:hypothetical protein
MHHPDYYTVNKTIETLKIRNIDIKYNFQNLKTSELAMDFFKERLQ